jgi:hypothetical protein
LKRKAEDEEEDVDPDYKALSRKQRRAIDAAYDQASGSSEGSGKRRKVEDDFSGNGGGFMNDDTGGGGFMMDESAGGGGFMGGGDDFMMEGGFFTENANEPIAQPTSHLYETPGVDGILFSALPGVMESLGLPWDEDVLAGFQGVSTSVNQAGEGYATKQDFRAVCAAMMDPEEDPMSEDDDEDDEDTYAGEQAVDAEMEGSDASSPLSDASGDEFNTSGSKSKTQSRKKTQSGKKSNQDLRLDPGSSQVKLSREQRDWITMMWNTMFEGTQPSIIVQHGPRVLGKEQVRRWADMMDQAWSDVEVSFFQRIN